MHHFLAHRSHRFKVSVCDHKVSIFRQTGLYQQFPLCRISSNLIGWSPRALTPLFGNRAGAHGIGKISCILTKIGKNYIVFNICMKFALLD